MVLDNCEHLVDACAEVAAAILDRCPGVRILATSRRPLGIPGEVSWRIPSLTVPSTRAGITPERLAAYDAVSLFTERASAARPGFELTDELGPVVAEICHRLDGVPLAIELAAARTRSLPPERILDGLSDSLRLLSGGSRMVLPRQQTIEASIEWSHSLLSEPSRRLLARLSVFATTFDLDAAVEVCSGEGVAREDVLALLDGLVEHSLVTSLDDLHVARFLMLETVRQFGQRHLERDGSRDVWQDRHAHWFADLAHRVAPGCETGLQHSAVARLRADHDNLVAALAWLRDRRQTDRLAAMVLDLNPYWDLGGLQRDSAVWASAALDLLPEGPSVLRARLTAHRGEARMSMGSRLAVDDCTTAMAMGTALGDARAAGRGSSTLTTLLSYSDFDAWRTQWEETVRLLRAADDRYALAGTLTWGAVPFIRRGHTEQGTAAIALARPHVVATGSPQLLASQDFWEGWAASNAGDHQRAEHLGNLAIESGALGSRPRQAGAEWVVAQARAAMGVEPFGWQEYAARARHAERDAERLAQYTYTVLAAQLALTDDPEAASALIAGLTARRMPPDPTLSLALVVGGWAAFRLGDLHDAALRADAALAHAIGSGPCCTRPRAGC